MEYIVKTKKMTLGRTTNYNKAVEWMNTHNSMCLNGQYATIVERD